MNIHYILVAIFVSGASSAITFDRYMRDYETVPKDLSAVRRSHMLHMDNMQNLQGLTSEQLLLLMRNTEHVPTLSVEQLRTLLLHEEQYLQHEILAHADTPAHFYNIRNLENEIAGFEIRPRSIDRSDRFVDHGTPEQRANMLQRLKEELEREKMNTLRPGTRERLKAIQDLLRTAFGVTKFPEPISPYLREMLSNFSRGPQGR